MSLNIIDIQKEGHQSLPANSTLNDVQKQECQVLLEEYKRLTNEISKRLDYCDKNVSYQFVLLGIVVTAVTAILTKKEVAGVNSNSDLIQYILLVSPLIFYILGFYYSINNMFILKIGQYVTTHIKPRFCKLLNSESIFDFENYFQTKVLHNSTKTNKVVALIVLQWTLSIPILLLAAYFALKLPDYAKAPIFDQQLLLLAINILFIFVAVRINASQHSMIARSTE